MSESRIIEELKSRNTKVFIQNHLMLFNFKGIHAVMSNESIFNFNFVKN